MNGAHIVAIACFVTVGLIAFAGLFWALGEIAKQPPGPTRRAVIDALWRSNLRRQERKRK